MKNFVFKIKEADLEFLHSCIVCSHSSFQKISDVRNGDSLLFFSTSICNNCGHIFRDIRPNEEWFLENFKIRHQYQVSKNWNPINPAIEEERYLRYHQIGEMLKNQGGSGNRLLDVGCGPGSGLDSLQKLGFAIEGIDSDESRSIIAKRKGYKIFEGNWSDYETATKFDFITSIHSLEHFHHPEKFLQKMRLISHQDTLLYVEVPEILDSVTDWNDSLYLAHMNNFNEFSLKKLASNYGWKFEKKINPYKGTSLPQGNLCMTFRPSSEIEETPVPSANESKFRTEVFEIYKTNLPVDNFENSSHFIVASINDLSLTFKRTQVVQTNLKDNFLSREVKSLGDNFFKVY